MKKIGLILIISLFVLFNANIVFAGFGVSPPKVLNYHLLPGSRFEQTIYLVQSKPEKDLLTKIEIDAPEIKDWISIDKGLEFIIPKGIQQFPIKVIVEVPTSAKFQHYGGRMWIKTTPQTKEGMVTIALGAIVDFDLTVSSEEVFGFVLRGVDISDTEQGRSIKIGVTLENVGNVKNRPTKIHLDVYDEFHKDLLYSGEATNLSYVGPFQTKTVIAKFSAKLNLGQYWADISVFKDNDTIAEDKRVFNVIERTGVLYKVFSHWYAWVILVVIIAAIAVVFWRNKIKRQIKRWGAKIKEKKIAKLEEKLKRMTKTKE